MVCIISARNDYISSSFLSVLIFACEVLCNILHYKYILSGLVNVDHNVVHIYMYGNYSSDIFRNSI